MIAPVSRAGNVLPCLQLYAELRLSIDFRMRRSQYLAILLPRITLALGAFAQAAIGGGILHPARLPLTPERMIWVNNMLRHTGATKEDFTVRAPDGVILRGWKVRPPAPNRNWVLLFHGIADNRTGNSGHAEFLLRHGYSVVMMDARAQGESSGDMATFGWRNATTRSLSRMRFTRAKR